MKSAPAIAQRTTPLVGSLNLLPMTYYISPTPLADEKIHGYLAYVREADREKIKAVGYGEMQIHIDYIKSRVGTIRKLHKKKPYTQVAMDFGSPA